MLRDHFVGFMDKATEEIDVLKIQQQELKDALISMCGINAKEIEELKIQQQELRDALISMCGICRELCSELCEGLEKQGGFTLEDDNPLK